MLIIATTLISIFLAINMGASGFSISFAPSYGVSATAKKDVVRRILFAWLIVPVLTGLISYLAHLVMAGRMG